MATEPSDPAILQYSRVGMTLERPWYVWVGAAVTGLWISTICVAALVAAVITFVRRTPEALVASFGCALAVLICLMLLVLEWRAVFRYSATASATVGVVLLLLFGVAALAEIQTIDRAGAYVAGSPEVWFVAALATSLGAACFTHFRWATLIANWLTRSLER